MVGQNTKQPMKTAQFAKIFLPLLLLVTPLIIYTPAMDQVLHPRFIYLSILLALGFLGVFLTVDKKVQAKLQWLDLAFIGFYTVHLLSIVFAYNKVEALFETQKVAITLGAYGLLRYFLDTSNEKKLHYFLKVLLLLSLVICGYGIKTLVDIYQEAGALYHSSVYAIKGLFAHKNLLSAFLLLLLPFNLWGTTVFKKLWKWMSIFNIIVILSLVFLLQTRAAYLGTFVFGGIMLLGALSNKNIRQQLPLKKIGMGGILIALISIGGLAATGSLSNLLDRLTSFGNTNSVQERKFLWQKSVQLIQDYPVLGVGSGNWRLMYPQYGVTGLKRAETEGVQFVRPHNDYLWIGSETGILGLFLFIGLFVFSILALIHQIRKAQTVQEAIPLWSLLAGVLAYMVIAFFDFPRERLEHQLLLVTYFALAANWGSGFFQNKQLRLPFNPQFVCIPIVLLYLFNAYMGYSRLQSELLVQKVITNTQKGKWALAKKQAVQAQTPFYNLDLLGNPIAWWEGITNFQTQKTKLANQNFQQSVQVHPYNQKIFNNLGSSHYLLKEYDKALEAYKKSLDINPKYEETHGNIARLYIEKRQFDLAQQHINQINKNVERKNQLIHLLNNSR